MSRATHIENYLVTVRTGQWFGWSDSKNKIYSNLVVYDGGAKPSESDCNNGLKAMQDTWDANNKSYRLKRGEAYASIGDQLDLLYKDILAGKVDATGEWAKSIKAVKDDNPKG